MGVCEGVLLGVALKPGRRVGVAAIGAGLAVCAWASGSRPQAPKTSAAAAAKSLPITLLRLGIITF